MSGLETDVNIILSAEDKASSVVQDAAKRINTSYREMNNQQRAVERSFTLQHQSLTQTMKVMQSAGTIVNRAIGIYNSYTLTQIRLADANSRAADSTTSLSEAIVRYGEGSPEAEKAAENQRKALEDLKQAQDSAAIGYALMATSIITDSTRIVTSVIPKLKSLNASIGGTSGKLGSIAKIGGATVGAGLLGAGILGSGALNPNATPEEKLASVGESALGGALLGATIGSVVPGIGTAIGAGAGAAIGTGVGVATNYGKEITQIFNFNGIVSDDIPGKVAEEAKRAATYSE